MSAVQQNESAVCIHTSPCSWASLPPHPTPLVHHRAPSWAPCAQQQLPSSHSFYTWLRLCVNPICPTLPFTPGSTCPLSMSVKRWHFYFSLFFFIFKFSFFFFFYSFSLKDDFLKKSPCLRVKICPRGSIIHNNNKKRKKETTKMSMDNWPEKIKSTVVYVKYLHSNKEYQMADPHNNMDVNWYAEQKCQTQKGTFCITVVFCILCAIPLIFCTSVISLDKFLAGNNVELLSGQQLWCSLQCSWGQNRT